MNQTLLLAAALLLCLGCGEPGKGSLAVTTRQDTPIEVKVVNNPNEAQTEAKIKALEDRVKGLENWAVKHGGRMR